MNGLNALGAAFSLCLLLVSVEGQFQMELFPLATSNSTSTPEIVTIPDSNGTSTSVYETTDFPIWSTTGHTPNVTSSNGTETTPTFTPTPTTTVTSTASPTTTQNPNHTTTELPPTSSVTPTVPVPTLPPEPVAPSEPWNLTYSGNSSNFCAMLSFAARIDISYNNVLNQSVQAGFDIPDNATVDTKKSKCMPGKNQQVFVLSFEFSPVSKGALTVTFRQDQSNNDSTIYGVQFSVLITEDLFPGISSKYLGKTVTLTGTNLTLFDTEPEHSFLCVSLIKTNLTSVQVHDQFANVFGQNSPFESGTLETSNLKVQAFMPSDQKIDTFFPNTECQQDKTDISSTIPITVGLILLFMVVVVLIAYFIGRSRQQKNTTTM